MATTKEKKKRTKKELDDLISVMRSKGYSNGEIARALDIPEVRVVQTLEVHKKRKK